MDVVVVGAGPTGLLLAIELAVGGAAPVVLEAAADGGRRARSLGLRSLTIRTVQTLRLRGLADPLTEAQWAMFDELAGAVPDAADEVGYLMRLAREGGMLGHFAGLPLTGESPVRLMLLKQHVLERVLAERARALGVEIRTGTEVVDVVDEGDRVAVVLADGQRITAAYVVGCDGGRSAVRKRAGIEFAGTPATMTGRTAIARLADPAAVRSTLRGPGGVLTMSLVQGEIATVEFDGGPDDRDTPLTAAELAASVERVGGAAVEVEDLVAGIRYSDNTRLADTYRRGRVLLAGDAAHVHSPIGGQGLNLGLQDAANVGWKLALVVRGLVPAALLDTYTAERRPVAETVLRNTRAQVALMRPSPQVDALREVLGEVLTIPEAMRHFGALANGTGIHYAPDAAEPPVGRFAADLDPAPFADGRAVLVDPGGRADLRALAAGYPDRLRVVSGQPGSPLLVRPDGYIAWAGDGDPGPALARLLGPATVPAAQ